MSAQAKKPLRRPWKWADGHHIRLQHFRAYATDMGLRSDPETTWSVTPTLTRSAAARDAG